MKPVMLSAIKPTNFLTLGNYCGALSQWKKYYQDFDSIFFVVNSHAITVREDPQELRHATYLALATYLACGLNPEEATLYVQSQVKEHAELAWILTCYASMGELSRMTQYKDYLAKNEGDYIGAGLFNYPILMAADILLFDTAKVPVGADQKQHVELCRDLAIRMNHLYQKDPTGPTLFTIPEPMIPPQGARIMSLQNPEIKMSKSDPDPMGAIYITDSDDVILKKFKKAVTDSGSTIAYNDTQTGIKNLLTIQSALSGDSIESLVQSYEGKMYGHLKIETAERVIATLKPIREQIVELMKHPDYLDSIAQKGKDKAQPRASLKVKQVKETIGLLT